MKRFSLWYYGLSVWRRTQLLLAGGAAAALLAAYVSQYRFGLQPCELCLQQRYPYMLVILLTGLVFLPSLTLLRQRWLLAITLLVLLGEAALAFRQAGVEQHWWPGPGCSAPLPLNATLDEIRAATLAAPLVRCDVPAFVYAGLSMAGWNALYALTLAAIAFMIMLRVGQGRLKELPEPAAPPAPPAEEPPDVTS